MSRRLVIPEVRLSFTDTLWKKGQYQGKETSYGCVLLFPPDHPSLGEIRHTLQKVKEDEWGDKPVRLVRDNPIRQAEESQADGFEPGWFFIRANNHKKPAVHYGHELLETEESAEGLIYPGVWAHAIIEIYAQNPKGAKVSFGKALNVSLAGVKFAKHDEPLSGTRRAAADEYEGLSSEDDDEFDRSSQTQGENPWD